MVIENYFRDDVDYLVVVVYFVYYGMVMVEKEIIEIEQEVVYLGMRLVVLLMYVGNALIYFIKMVRVIHYEVLP